LGCAICVFCARNRAVCCSFCCLLRKCSRPVAATTISKACVLHFTTCFPTGFNRGR
jgi:hypothetical protein